MKIAKIGWVWFPVTALGYGKRIGVWFQGCKRQCENCISPKFQTQEGGSFYTAKEILDRFCEETQIDGLTISGGEPFEQPEALLELVIEYKKRMNGDILVFSGYTLEELHEKHTPVIEEILHHIAVLVDGTYIEEKNNGIGLRGSWNQNIHIWNYHERYSNAETKERTLQCVLLKNQLCFIGIPPK
ncbi:MAG: radical SAM protein [Lachnospiraceae bacterium]|nr:radical SAM protein [Lachnospiraceae bacterium]